MGRLADLKGKIDVALAASQGQASSSSTQANEEGEATGKEDHYDWGYNYAIKPLMVATLVKDKKILAGKDAVSALQKEWDNLQERKCWDLKKARPWREIQREMNAKGKRIHLGSLCELVYLKGSELPEGHAGRKLKGRVVFLGDRVRDQLGAAAVFEELTSSPAGMEASRFCDLYDTYGDHTCMQSDAPQAYTQAPLDGETPTFIKVHSRLHPQLRKLGIMTDKMPMSFSQSR